MANRNLGTQSDRERVRSLINNEKDGWRKERLIALKLGFDPARRLDDIAETVGRDRSTVQRWFKRFKEEGFDGVLERDYSEGRPSTCDEEVWAYLKDGLTAERWNTLVEAREELERYFERRFHYQNVWRWVKKCTGVLRVPRPVHEKRDPARAEAFKRHFFGILKNLPVSGKKPVKVWFADESRYGLLPNLRRLWTNKGQRPHKRWKSEYKWSYCYGAIDAVEGKTVFLQTPTVSLDWTEAFLLQIKKQYPGHEHIVVWDGAGFHPRDSFHEQVPPGIHVVLLPPYSPELNPIEKLWDLIQDHTSNKLWPSIERLDQVVALHLKDWWENPERVIRLFGNGWIRASANDT